MKAWRATEPGAPLAVLRLEEVDVPAPGPGEVLIRVEAVTLNFNDIDGIHGRYATVRTPFPYIPGMEVLGRVIETGEGAAGWHDRRVVATAGSAEKTAFCRELGADVAIDYHERDFVDGVLDATGGRGVDVAFDTIGGAVTVQTFGCMAFNGRHVLAGFASGIEHEDEGLVPRPVRFGNFSLVGVCHAYADDPLEFKRMTGGMNFPSHTQGEETHARLLALLAGGEIRPIIGRDVPFADLPAALDAMERRATIGRTVVRV